MPPPPTRVALVALLGAAALLVAGCSGPEVAPDRLTTSDSVAVTGEARHVTTPAGRVEVVLGEPVDRLAPGDTADGEEYAAADGERLVPVEWWLEPSLAPLVGPPDSRAPIDEDAPVVEVAVVLGPDPSDRRVLPGTPGRFRTARSWLSVPDGVDPVVEVTYAGLTQRLDPTSGEVEESVASAYAAADLGTSDYRTCRTSAPGRTGGLSFTRGCIARVVTGLPYVEGPGWAEPGTTWAIFAISASDRLVPVPDTGLTFYTGDGGTVTDVRCGPQDAVEMDREDPRTPWLACLVDDGGTVDVTATARHVFTLDEPDEADEADEADERDLPPTVDDEFTLAFVLSGGAS